MKTKFTGYIPITPMGRKCYACGDDLASEAKKNIERSEGVTWGSLLVKGWTVGRFEYRKGAK